MKLLLTNTELETLSTKEKIRYFESIRDFCKKKQFIKNGTFSHNVISNLYSFNRNYDYKIIGEENIPADGKAIFVCNHSNSHDFFTSHEIFHKLGLNVSVFAASDGLSLPGNIIFRLCKSTLIDRRNKASIEAGTLNFITNLMNGLPSVIFGETTWNIHPYKLMHQVKLGPAKFGAITELPIVPTIYEYVESPEICSKESMLYTKCVVKFSKPIIINPTDNLIIQTDNIQKALEESRLELWKQLGIVKTSLKDINKEIYLNHTYLKKFGAFGYNYDSEYESRFLFSKDKTKVENEYCLDEYGNLVPGITKKRIIKRL